MGNISALWNMYMYGVCRSCTSRSWSGHRRSVRLMPYSQRYSFPVALLSDTSLLHPANPHRMVDGKGGLSCKQVLQRRKKNTCIETSVQTWGKGACDHTWREMQGPCLSQQVFFFVFFHVLFFLGLQINARKMEIWRFKSTIFFWHPGKVSGFIFSFAYVPFFCIYLEIVKNKSGKNRKNLLW